MVSFVVAMNRVDVVDLVVDLVDVNLDIDLVDVDLDVDLVDVDLVDILFVVLLMSLRGKFCEKRCFCFFVVSIADPKNAYFHGLEPQDHARTLSFEKSYPTH